MYVISWRQTYLLKEKAYFSKIKWSEEGGLGIEKWFLPPIFLTKQYMKILPGRRSAPNDIPNPFEGLKVIVWVEAYKILVSAPVQIRHWD